MLHTRHCIEDQLIKRLQKSNMNSLYYVSQVHVEPMFGRPSSQGSKDLALVYAEHLSPSPFLGLVHDHSHCILKHLLHTTVA